MKRVVKRLGLIVIILSILVILIECGKDVSSQKTSGNTNSNKSEGITIASEIKPTIGLKIQEIQPKVFTSFVTAPGKIRANQDKVAIVGPIIEGRISKVFVNWGDIVKKGQLLAYLESVEVGEAKAAYFKAKAELQVAKAELMRKKRLFEDQIIPEKDLLEAEAAYTSAQAEADAAEKALHVIGFTEEEVASLSKSHDLTAMMPIISPISGIIVNRQAVIGALAEPSSELFTIIDLSSLWIDAQVYEKDLDKIQLNQKVEISVIAYPNETFLGRVSYIGDTLDEETRTTVVRTVVNNPDRKLKPGMFATVKIITSEKKESMVLPEGAVLHQNGKSFVVVEETGKYIFREVKLGAVNDSIAEVIDGLKFGDRVVIKGHYQIATELMSSAGVD